MVKFVQTRMQGMNPEDLGEKTRMMPLLPAVPEPAIPEVAPSATVVRIYTEEDLPQEDTKRVEENEQDAHAKNTQRNYNTSFAQFRRWCEERHSASPCPPTRKLCRPISPGEATSNNARWPRCAWTAPQLRGFTGMLATTTRAGRTKSGRIWPAWARGSGGSRPSRRRSPPRQWRRSGPRPTPPGKRAA